MKMRTLVIETASEACSVALFEDRDLLACEHRVLGRGHAERLVPMIAQLPQKGRAERILVSLGPGSFTGVRIGLATARALGVAWKAEVLGYPTLHLINAQSRQPGAQASTVCINGGHGQWFVQNFNARGEAEGQLLSLTPAQVVEFPLHQVVAGNRAKECVDLVEGDRLALNLLPDAKHATLLHPFQLTVDLRPIYGRAPDARPQMAAALS